MCSVCVCACNQKVPGSIPDEITLVLLLSKKLYSHCSMSTQLFEWGLVSTGETAHPAVTSMGTLRSKCQLSMSCIVGEDPGGTLGAHTLTCETWYSLLQVTSQYPMRISPVMTHNTRVAQRLPSASHWLGMTAQRQPKGFALCMCAFVQVHNMGQVIKASAW